LRFRFHPSIPHLHPSANSRKNSRIPYVANASEDVHISDF
jgi:hypothetical protein